MSVKATGPTVRLSALVATSMDPVTPRSASSDGKGSPVYGSGSAATPPYASSRSPPSSRMPHGYGPST